MVVEVPASFTLDELLAQLRSEPEENAQGYKTMAEWAGYFGVAPTRMDRILNQASHQGKLLCKRISRPRRDGVMTPVPVYAFSLDVVND